MLRWLQQGPHILVSGITMFHGLYSEMADGIDAGIRNKRL
jgi:hypothetical protein